MTESWEGRLRAGLAGVLVGTLIAAAGGCRQESAVVGIWANLDQVRTYLEGDAQEAGFSGVVLIGRREEVVFEAAYGLADADLGVPMRTDYRFRIGSLTKPITASAILVAVDRGLRATWPITRTMDSRLSSSRT